MGAETSFPNSCGDHKNGFNEAAPRWARKPYLDNAEHPNVLQ